jgi:DivIVA domain-containing protein
MDSPKSSSQQSSLDSLRTVEFRQTLRGYHIDDVDEYLERVAIEAEALQEQMRQSADRIRQAAERIAQLETSQQQLEQQLVQAQAQSSAAPSAAPAAAPDDALQRTLLLAQKFVDQTEAEAEAQARSTLAEAEARAHTILTDAENRARALTEETERHLREDVARLESVRTQLAGDVETIARHLDTERNRLRAALGDMLTWVDEHVQPAASLLAQPPPPPPAPLSPSTASSSDDERSARPGSDSRGPGAVPPSTGVRPEMTGPSSPAPPGATPPADTGAGTAPGGRQGTMPLSDPEGARAGVPH